jgi:hypothetical protein
MRARSILQRVVAGCGLAVLVAGCRDSAVAPASAGAHPTLALASSVGVTSFVYDPSVAQTYSIPGGHKISFPVAAVCDPLLSSYGVTEWDKPCAPLVAPIAITATSYIADNGHPYVDFQPALRFVPGSDVVLYMKDKDAAANPTATIKWCDALGVCVDESVTQPSAVTRRDVNNNIVYRLIKHFSGYLISAS